MGDAADRSRRLTAPEIFEAVARSGRDELARSWTALALSGLAAGLTMGLSALAVATVEDVTGPGLLPAAFYPIGFIAVIIGRQQLFTENTLYPVVLVFDERRHLADMLRLWGVVLTANLGGTFLFALLASRTPAVSPAIRQDLVALGIEVAAPSFGEVFWSGIIGGWLIALVAWLVSASLHTIGQVAVIWLLAFLIGVGGFAHSVAATGEVFTAALVGDLGWGAWARWQAAATLGNVAGGVVIVSLLNYGQVRGGDR
ncbi:MAG TPA: formate/nitrite transporter family protein [Actinomycetota bacterium]|nr:formate/nitrite transporter family protein [Actinomycetota bacterium]